MKKSKLTLIGVFIVVILSVLVWGMNFLKGLNLFEQEKNYYAVYEKVGGLERSSRVMLNGFQVGQVKNIYFDTTDYKHLVVKMIVNQDIKIPLKSIAKIVSSDLMGTKEIQLIFSDSKELHTLGDTLDSDIEKELKEEVNAQIAPLRSKAEDLIRSFDSVLVGVQSVFTESTRENLRITFLHLNKTIKNLGVITEELSIFVKDEKGHVSDIFRNVDTLSLTLKNNSHEIDNIIQNLSDVSDSLNTVQFSETFRKAEEAFEDMSDIANKLNSPTGSLGKLINDPDLYINLEKSSKELEKLLKDFQENPDRYIQVSVFGGRNKNDKSAGKLE